MWRGTVRASLGAISFASILSPVFSVHLDAAPPPPVCVGDCDDDGAVRIDELVTAVHVALGSTSTDACAAFECPQTLPGAFISCGIVAVHNALYGCPQAPLPTPTPGFPDDLPTPYTLSTLDEPCGRETGSALLAGVRPEYSAPLIPRPETGWPNALLVTVRLRYEGGPITCYPRYVPPPWSARLLIDERIGLVVEVELDTADGAFAERVQSELKGGHVGGSLSLSRRPEELQGTYRPDLPGYEDVRVGMSGNFWGDWSNGVILQTGQRPGYASEYIPLAYWQPTTDPPSRF